MATFFRKLDTTKFKRVEGALTPTNEATNHLKNEVYGRNHIYRDLVDMGFVMIKIEGKRYFKDLELIYE